MAHSLYFSSSSFLFFLFYLFAFFGVLSFDCCPFGAFWMSTAEGIGVCTSPKLILFVSIWASTQFMVVSWAIECMSSSLRMANAFMNFPSLPGLLNNIFCSVIGKRIFYAFCDSFGKILVYWKGRLGLMFVIILFIWDP